MEADSHLGPCDNMGWLSALGLPVSWTPSGWRCPLSLRSMTDAYFLLQRNPTSRCPQVRSQSPNVCSPSFLCQTADAVQFSLMMWVLESLRLIATKVALSHSNSIWSLIRQLSQPSIKDPGIRCPVTAKPAWLPRLIVGSFTFTLPSTSVTLLKIYF